ncbi:MAG: DUF433 domain-containing protein [Acidobacteria bacterium]|nr:DUF433 domain-containing protein [Acidobacteriota bacterium]
MNSEYVEFKNGGYYVKGVRVSLDSIVHCFQQGASPEAIQEDFPVLQLSQVYGAIAFYLDNKAEVDRTIRELEREVAASTIPVSVADPELWAKIEKARAAMANPRA